MLALMLQRYAWLKVNAYKYFQIVECSNLANKQAFKSFIL